MKVSINIAANDLLTLKRTTLGSDTDGTMQYTNSGQPADIWAYWTEGDLQALADHFTALVDQAQQEASIRTAGNGRDAAEDIMTGVHLVNDPEGGCYWERYIGDTCQQSQLFRSAKEAHAASQTRNGVAWTTTP